MSNYDNNNQIAIWGNDKREKDTHPHFKGKGTIDGVDYYVSAWRRSEDAKPNAPALKLSLTKVSDVKDRAVNSIQAQASTNHRGNAYAPAQTSNPTPGFEDDLDEQIPF